MRARRSAGVLFVAPVMVLFAALLLGPLLYALYLSLFAERLVGGTVFAGLDHYAEAVRDAAFGDGLARVLVFMAVQVPVMLGLALAFALVLDSGRVRFPRLIRLGIFVPYAVPTVIAALMWGFLYGEEFGLLGGLHLLDSPLLAIGNVVTWTFTGYNAVILYAALRTIPRELLDAAAVDGAGPLRTALSIKLPLLRPALGLCAIFSVIGSLQLFNEPAIVDQLAPDAITRSYTPNLYIYSLAFTDQRLNYAAALSFLLGVVAFALSVVVMAAARRSRR